MQIRSEETRARILTAAETLFSQQGFDAAGVAEICAAAGVSKGAFYHHFPSKQAVFLALLENWLAGFSQLLSQFHTGAASVPDALVEMTSALGSILAAASGQMPLFLEFWTQSSRDPAVWQAAVAPYHRFEDYFAGLVAQGVAEGSLRPLDPTTAARTILALAIGLVLQGLLDPHNPAWAQTPQASMTFLLEGLKRSES